MIVKLVRRRVGESDVYDIYVGIRRIFFPFIIQWFPDVTDLSEKEAKGRIWNSYLSVKGTKLTTVVE